MICLDKVVLTPELPDVLYLWALARYSIALRAMERLEITIQPVRIFAPTIVHFFFSIVVFVIFDDGAIIRKHGHNREV